MHIRLLFTAVVLAAPLAAQDVAYSLGRWEADSFGNQRAVLRVGAAGSAVVAQIPWRRRDDPAGKRIIVVSAQTGRRISNAAALRVDREEGVIVFQPESGPGDYYVYYLSYQGTFRSNYPRITYRPADSTAAPEWLANARAHVRDLPLARVTAFQAVDSMSAVYPMEVIATEDEREGMQAENADATYLLFPESRSYPIRMLDDIPLRWIEAGPNGPVTGEAGRGEFFVFQIGVWSVGLQSDSLAVRWSSLRGPGGDSIGVKAFQSFNTGGVDWQGRVFARALKLAPGRVQPLWIGMQVPEDAAAGVYEGTLTVEPQGAVATTLPVRLTVVPHAVAHHGDDEPWRLSRLRWLDSRLALDSGVVAPYVPVRRAGTQLSVLGRDVSLTPTGLPAQITSHFTEEMTAVGAAGRDLLAAPITLAIEDAGGRALAWKTAGVRFAAEVPGLVSWDASGTAGGVTLLLHGQLEFDGALQYTVRLTGGPAAVSLSDVRLEIPLRHDVARYLMGMGYKGGEVPDTLTWRWDQKKNQDAAWIGDVNAGMQFTLFDQHYERPLNTNFYQLKPLILPESWWNGGKGECRFAARGAVYRVRCGSGSRTLAAGDTLYFNLRLLLTPFHPIDTRAQFTTRYFHAYKPVDTVAVTGANVINVHHATAINPYINYPFFRTAELRSYVDSAHAAGMRVKLYYTVRELTNRAPELWALRSFGNEVFADGPGGGHSFLQEHLVENYITGWVVPELRDVAIVTSGISRWHNFYVEGLDWLARNTAIDGLYLDDVAFDRTTMQRIRRVLDRSRPGALIDLHSANQYNPNDGFASSANLYLEHFPYLNRLWFGEYFNYDSPPAYWLAEISGIPFGLMGEMLEGGGNPWRGAVFGMTSRLPWSGDPRPIWKVWDDFGIADARMIGWWVKANPVRTGRTDVLATSYVRDGKTLVALASWAPDTVAVTLTFDWTALRINPVGATVTAPAVEKFQEAQTFRIGEQIPVAPGKGWLLVVESAGSR